MTSSQMIRRWSLFCGVLIVVVFISAATALPQENVFIAVIDGARFTESFGAESTYMPMIWNHLRKEGSIYTSFRNEGKTVTCPGHATLLTGVWQQVTNDGSERPSTPTLFEYYRHQRHAEEQTCYVVAGKPKLAMLTYGTDTAYGVKYRAAFAAAASVSDRSTYDTLATIMKQYHPHLVMINFPEVDIRGHANDWNGYLGAIRRADSLIYLLWNRIQSDSVYANRTTLFVTNDHGRHDEAHGGFKDHGDDCEGCRHILLLALGPKVPRGIEVHDRHTQRDVAPTAATLLGLTLPHPEGTTLLFPLK